MTPMTKRQEEIYDFIGSYCDTYGYSPTFREIADEFGLSGTNAVEIHLRPLEKKGYITRLPGKFRTLRVVREGKTS